MMKKNFLILAIILFSDGCGDEDSKEEKSAQELMYVPEWSRNVIWYQIFPERFRNGDSSNDPTREDILMTYPEQIPDNWKVSDWGSDWYLEDEYMKSLPVDMDFNSRVQLRRYGGDLQGVLDKIDYLVELGITGIYFNPLNDAPSLHKYDPRHWRHIDRNFGPDPKGDVVLMNREVPDDPSSWVWTEADRLFLEVVEKLHKEGIRVIMDYSWNHTGYDFWAVNDIRKNQRESRFTDWYEVESYDDPGTPKDETAIKGWWGFKYLPLIRENVVDPDSTPPHNGNFVSELLKEHIFNVSRRWLDPNGDGNFEDGVDGFRMDVAAEVTMGFWADYRMFVKSVNPEAVLIGEVWWFDWPDISGPEKMVQGDAFDGLMNYRWYMLARGFFSQGDPVLKPSEFVAQFEKINTAINLENQQAMMNLSATHDTPRLSTCFFNDGRYKEKAKLSEDANYKVYRPDEQTWKEVRMFLLHQFSFIGSPQIWNGDELGMWGADDPDNRKPIWWGDIKFELESAQAYSPRKVAPDTTGANLELLGYYKKVIAARIDNPVLAFGDLEYLLVDDEKMILGYSRTLANQQAIAVFNRSREVQPIQIEVKYTAYKDVISGRELHASNGQLLFELKELEGRLLVSY